MFQEITYYPILGKPFIMYLGIATLLSFSITAYIGYTNLHGMKGAPPFAWHPRLAMLSFSLAVIHATLGILLYF
ncbi:MAG: hypothetical protein V1492_05510 [Candidatus Micrarchaeota archaeon]